MRFTRPGARACHTRSEGTKLRGSVLRPGVENEGTGPKLRPREVLQLVAGPVGRVELDVEVMVAAAGPAWRRLMHRHHIGERLVEQPVIFLEQSFEGARKRFVVRL